MSAVEPSAARPAGTTAVRGREFALCADGRIELWTGLVGAVVEHDDFGVGTITGVTPRKGYIPLIEVRFVSDNESATFNSESFTRGVFSDIHLPEFMAAEFLSWHAAWAAEEARRIAQEAEQRARRAADEAARMEFRELARKYHVPEGKLGFTPLAAILLKMEAGEHLDAGEEDWLESQRIFNVLATYHYRRFRRDGDGWKLVRACRNLRQAEMPEKALEISAAALRTPAADPRIRAALLTTRGGALRDLQETDRAAECAHEAIRLSPGSFHPWNLLGAVYYGKGNPAKGDECFGKALELGASPRMQEAEIRSALTRSDVEVRRTVAAYLIGKDPRKYAWADAYLQHQA